jgi:hypothetical protein
VHVMMGLWKISLFSNMFIFFSATQRKDAGK